MKNLLIIAMAFIVPLATILLYIAADQGLMKLVKWFKNKRQAKKLALKTSAAQPTTRPVLIPITIEGKAEIPAAPKPAKHSCQRCKGCKKSKSQPTNQPSDKQ